MRRVLIANRGEIACRVIRSCRDLEIATVGVYSDADSNALHVSLSDQAVHIGPAKPIESYLKIDAILDAARTSGTDAIHPGYGFLAENADFARRVESAGLIWVGPAPETIEAMGDKERARQIALEAEIPVLPGSARFGDQALEGLADAASAVGFPLLVKAAGGGGGIGMRRVDEPGDLEGVAEATQAMAARSFGDSTIYLERFVPRARHIEVQIFGMGNGRAVHLNERDCSIQRRFQKIIEESPAPGLAQSTRADMTEAAVRLACQQRYRGAGTVEFILDAESQEFFFLEMNTRIQVEHAVTEMVTGEDLVALQLKLAGGDDLKALDQEQIQSVGHAIECRLYAENPDKMFLPSPGTLESFALPQEQKGVRIDAGVRQGDEITVHYDPMIAKVICHADDRRAAIDKSLSALKQTELGGLTSNLSFLKKTLAHHAFGAGAVTTSFIDDYKADLINN